jgi:hypothetical protein
VAEEDQAADEKEAVAVTEAKPKEAEAAEEEAEDEPW